MFYDNSKSGGGKNSGPKKEITGQQAGMIILLIAGAAAANHAAQIENFYIRNFQMIWMGAWVIVLGFIILALRWFVNKNRDAEKDGITYEHLVSKGQTGCIYVGHTEGTGLSLSRKQRLGHVQILGTTGRGKTESLVLPWIVRDANAGSSSLLIDGKGDPEIAYRVQEALNGKATVKVFDLGNPEKSFVMNPLKFGSAQAITDRIFASFDFPDPFYKGVQYDLALAIVSAIKSTGEIVSFQKLHACLVNDVELAKLGKDCTDVKLKTRIQKMLASPRATREQNQMGLVSQLAPFAEGEVAHLVNGRENGDKAEKLIEFENLLLQKSGEQSVPMVCIVLLPTLKFQIAAKQLGRMLLQELAGLIGERASREGKRAEFFSVYLDQFPAFAYQGFEQILNKARSSRVALHLSHQSMADLSMVSPDFARVVNTNTNVKCLLGLNDPDTADFYARHIGTRGSERRTERVEDRGWMAGNSRTGQASVREVEEYKIHPNELKNFTNGVGVLHLPTPDGNFTARVQFARLYPKECVSE
jgi:type IV secretory pathway TraG/TraD family ATPase VirD4